MDIKCILVTDFKKICRICMKFDKTFLSTKSFNITNMIIACASVQISENDDLPNQICNACFLQLQNTINFKQLCESSDKAFRQIIENNKNNLWNNQNDLDNVKNEEFHTLDYANGTSPVYIKEEVLDVTNQNDSGKSETNNIEDEATLEIENEDRPKLNRRDTRRKAIQYKFEEESDNSDDKVGEKDSDWESEDEESVLDEQRQINDYKCGVCSETFKRVDSLGLHMHRKHNVEGTKCKKCSLICYHPLHLRAHEKLHNKCSICNLSFSTRKKLELHKVTHDNEEIPEITCKMCAKEFTCKTNINKHMRDVHKIETKKCSKCDVCDETFKTKRLLEKHNRKMHPKAKRINRQKEIVNCEICDKSIQRRHLRTHMTIHGERDKIACEYCAKIFVTQQSLQTHVRTYHKKTGPAPVCRYLCTKCGLKLRTKYKLTNHLITHTKERPFPCDKCDKTYRTPWMLKEHVSRVHLNQRNFVCTFCSQAFFDKKILLNHVRRHTGEKPFKCHICKKSFIQKVALQVHIRVHTDSI